RYFPEPDLPPLIVSNVLVAEVRAALPELPGPRAKRFSESYGLSYADASQLTGDRSLADYYEAAVVASGGNARAAANWIRSELLRELENAGLTAEKSAVPATELGALVRMIDEDKISGKQGKDVLVEMFATGKPAAAIVEEKGLVQVSDSGEIDRVIDEVMAGSPNQLEQYRAGKETLFGFFVGQVMKASKGKANPKVVNERLKAKLKS
ncbi:MAG TPA: hypothetical protein VE961_13980, partial [Pyrinomonadaceae bacterium]|nr:hypothetical protein [Pyrinomonadaceae bacterium]